MRRFGWSISRHLLGSVLPYFVLSWILLSVILFFQQAGRYSDIFFSVSIPRSLVFELTLALIPNVIAFTCPMAALVGVIIGLSKMQGDSELVAIRAAGVGNMALTLPLAMLGIALSVFALAVNIKGVPLAAALAKRVAIQSAILRLESPIEPGAFNTGLGGLTVFVRDGNPNAGTWRNLYIFNEDRSNQITRLITARYGRIDATENDSELVLNDAVITTLPGYAVGQREPSFVSEQLGEVRFSVKTGRAELAGRMQKIEEGPEALGLIELGRLAREAAGKERAEAQILFGRRLLLSLTPFLFSLLGASLVLRYNRGGRGFGFFLALVSLIAYYLLTLLGEQITRTTGISTVLTSLIPIGSCLAATAWFYTSDRFLLRTRRSSPDLGWLRKFLRVPRISGGREPISARRNLLAHDIARSILKYFALASGFLSAIFVIFTAFDMWRFAGSTAGGTGMLLKYLAYLLPLVYLQIAPPALMIATLATYVIKSRESEIVAWTAAGQSVFRLLRPAIVLMIAIGGFNLVLQETVLPRTNQIQDALRDRLRAKGVIPSTPSRSWSATASRIYNFDAPAMGGRGVKSASNMIGYEFADDGTLAAIYRSGEARWDAGVVSLGEVADKVSLVDGRVVSESAGGLRLAESEHPFSYANQKPAHLNIVEARAYISESDSAAEKRTMEVALQRKYSTPFLPLLLVLFTAPFGLSLGRKGKLITIGYAVAAWLVFTGVVNLLEQMGNSGQLPPSVAVWLPLLAFSAIGVILLTRAKT